MIRTCLAVLAVTTVLSLSFPALAGKPDKTPKKADITWVRIEPAQFSVEEQLGTLTSCAYRLCEEGKAVEFIYVDKARVVASKSKDAELLISLYVAKPEIKTISRELMVDAIEDATQQCYERMTDK
jgi:hypothetical protein